MVTAMPFDRMDQIATQVARIVTGYIRERHLEPGRDLTILISSDANHYGPDFANVPYGLDAESHRRAVNFDRELVDTHLTGQLAAGKIEALTGSLWRRTYTDPGSVVWCGKYSIPFGLLTVLHCFERPLEGTLLRYGDTYSGGVLPITGLGIGLTAPFSLKHWVGFCSVVFQ